MEPIDQPPALPNASDRVWKSWAPPVAAVGALAALVAAAFRVRPQPRASAAPAQPAVPASAAPVPGALQSRSGRMLPMQPAGPGEPASTQIRSAEPDSAQPTPGASARLLAREYRVAAVIGGAASISPFRRSLSGVAIGDGDTIAALGDDEVRVFDPGGIFVRGFRVIENALCLEVDRDERVFVGAGDRVEAYDRAGQRVGGFTAGDMNRPAAITAIAIFKDSILVADAATRIIRRFDRSGHQLGLIGNQNKTGNFILPNGSLDIAVDAAGIVRATDTGRHQVTAWAMDGAPVSRFGKFGMMDPVDFVGCCNPVNLALTPDGKIVTAEKMVARVKVYEPDGTLLALMGPEHFDPSCIHIHVAVDSQGRILAADPVRRAITVFVRVEKATAIDAAGEREGA